MLSRILNIWVIKQRASHPPKTADACIDTASLNSNSNTNGASTSASSSDRSTPPKRRPQSPSRRSGGNGRRPLSRTRERISQFIVRITDAEQKSIVRLRGKASHIREITSQRWYIPLTSLHNTFQFHRLLPI